MPRTLKRAAGDGGAEASLLPDGKPARDAADAIVGTADVYAAGYSIRLASLAT
jgi:hypothetical protein